MKLSERDFIMLFIGLNWKSEHDLVRLAKFVVNFPKKKEIQNNNLKSQNVTSKCDNDPELPTIPDCLKNDFNIESWRSE